MRQSGTESRKGMLSSEVRETIRLRSKHVRDKTAGLVCNLCYDAGDSTIHEGHRNGRMDEANGMGWDTGRPLVL